MPKRLLPKFISQIRATQKGSSNLRGPLLGFTLLLFAEFFFSCSTVFAKLASNLTVVNPHLFVFLRFSLGLIFVTLLLWQQKESFLPNRWELVIARGVLNTISVSFFFLAIANTSVTNANMLNMTYPAFIFLLAPLAIKEKTHPQGWFYLLLTMLGVLLVIKPDFHHINMGDVYGILSGFISAAAIISLRVARKHESSMIILFYLMLIGTAMTGIFVFPQFVIPSGLAGLFVWAAAITGFFGQALITMGYKYIAATTGSLVSASRIIFATALGVSLCGDQLTITVVLGGLLILWSLISLSILGLQHRIDPK